jgi:NTP pyrophosphatase (non-canonical NTP hydrolase)
MAVLPLGDTTSGFSRLTSALQLGFATGCGQDSAKDAASGRGKFMADVRTTVSDLREAMRRFVAERDWDQFHSPKNLAMGLAIEAAELMEHFQWVDAEASRQVGRDPVKRVGIGEEMADVACYLFALANALDLDLSDAVIDKLQKNAQKYPAEEFRGKYTKN